MNEPPFRIRNSGGGELPFAGAADAVHSHTFPPIPYTPNALSPLSNSFSSTGVVPGGRFLWTCQYSRLLQGYFSSFSRKTLPQGNSRLSGPRAATSHSSAVGSRFPAHAAYAAASSQVTSTTGWRSRPRGGLFPPQCIGAGRPVAAANA